MSFFAPREVPKPTATVPTLPLVDVLTHVPAFVLGAGAGAVWRRSAIQRFVRAVKCHRFSRRGHASAGYCGREHDVVLSRRGFAVGYSYSRKCPLWASAIICGDSVQKFATRAATETFSLDSDIAASQQAKPAEFINSGYDRGHLIPRATASFDELSCEQTYLMTNIFPQDPDLNRGPWKAFESDVRKWADRYGRLALVVGTHFDTNKSKCTVIGNGVGVPDQVFAAVIAIDCPGRPSLGILVPNVSPKRPDRSWSEQFPPMSLNELEKRLDGRSVFRSLPWRQRPWFWHRRSVDINLWL